MNFFELKCPTLSYAVRACQNENGIWISMADICAALSTSYLPSTVKTRFLNPDDVMKTSFPGSSGVGLFVNSSAIKKFAHVGNEYRAQKIEQWIKKDVEPLVKKRRAKVTPIRPVEPEVGPETESLAEVAQPDAVSNFIFPVTSQTVRVTKQDGEPWFVAKDVCDALGLRTDNLKAILDEDEVKNTNPYSIGVAPGGRDPLIISEPGLYGLIIKSRKPEAQAFKRWIKHDVLPAIRKDGAYVMGEEKVKTGELEEAEFLLQAFTMLRNKADRLAQENAQLENDKAVLALENTKMLPKAEMYDQFMDSTGLISVTNAGKIFGMSGRSMGAFLRDISWIFKRTDELIPMQHVLDAGLMGVITGANERNGHPFVSGRLTPQGIEVLFNKYGLQKKAI